MQLPSFMQRFLLLSVSAGLLTLLLLPLSAWMQRRFRMRRRSAYWLWVLVMLRFAIPFAPALPALVRIETPAISLRQAESDSDRTLSDAASPDDRMQTPETTSNPAHSLTPAVLLCIGWAAGGALFLSFNIIAHIRVSRAIRRTRRLPSDALLERYRNLVQKQKLRRPPALYLSAGVQSPVLSGLMHPAIFLPENFYDSEAADPVLLHELTHSRRGDLYVRLLCLLARTLHWFNPAVHLASARCLLEMELSCDEIVLNGASDALRRAYGGAILTAARTPVGRTSALSSSFRSKKQALRARLNDIMDTRPRRRMSVALLLTALLCMTAGSAVGCRTSVSIPAVNLDGVSISESGATDADGHPVVSFPEQSLALFVNGSLAQLPALRAEDGGILLPAQTVLSMLGVSCQENADNLLVGGVPLTGVQRDDAGNALYVSADALCDASGAVYYSATPGDTTQPFMTRVCPQVMVSNLPEQDKKSLGTAVSDLKSALITAYEARYGDFEPLETPPDSYSEPDSLRYAITALDSGSLLRETDRFYVFDFFWELYADRYSDDIFLLYHGLDDTFLRFDPASPDALSLAG